MKSHTGSLRILRFAAVGLVAGFLIAESFTALKPSNIVGDVLVWSSPGVWLFAHVGWAGHPVIFSFVVLPIANGVLYALAGAVLALLTSKRDW